MRRIWMAAPLLALLLTGVAPASAYEATPSNDRTKAYAAVGRNCADEARRFCAPTSTGLPEPHGAAVCLRPYMSSLSLQCRAALRNVSSQAQQ